MRPGNSGSGNRDYRDPHEQPRGGGKNPQRYYPQTGSHSHGYQGEEYPPYHSGQRNLGDPGGFPSTDLGHQQHGYDPYYYQGPEESQDWEYGQGQEYDDQPGYYQQGQRQKESYPKEKPYQARPYKQPKKGNQPYKNQYHQEGSHQQEEYQAPYVRESENPGYDPQSQSMPQGRYSQGYQKYQRYDDSHSGKNKSYIQKQSSLFPEDSSYQEDYVSTSNPQYKEGSKKKKHQHQIAPSNVPGVQNTNSMPEVRHTSTEKDYKGKKLHGASFAEQGSVPFKSQKKDMISGTSFQSKPEDLADERFSKTMSKFNTLDRGTYFINEDNKKAHFLVAGRKDILGWYDTYVINGYFLHGAIIKLTTLTARIFLFIENVHPIFKEFLQVDENDGETVRWTEKMHDSEQIVTVSFIEKVEVFDNDEEGFEGFVCYTICEDSQIEFLHQPEEVGDFRYVQELILLYEPTSIRKIYLDVVYNSIYKPESKGFGGKRIAAIINPNLPGETIEFQRELQLALDKNCVVGTVWIQNGKYTLTAQTIEDMEGFCKLVDLALDIAEELNAYVMITNLRRTFDLASKTILYISSDPTVKLIRSSNPISFANKVKVSENLS